MNCDDAHELLFESLAQEIPEPRKLMLETHLASCDACRALAEAHRRLDECLMAATPSVSLSQHFRMRLQARMKAEADWPDYLPDIAHLTGCALAVGSLLVFLPEYRERVGLLGAAFTAASYFLQAVLRDAGA